MGMRQAGGLFYLKVSGGFIEEVTFELGLEG